MITTSHVIVGGAVGIITKNPVAAFAAGIASHLLCDMIPHIDAPFKLEYRNGVYDQVIWTRKLVTFAILDSVFAFLLTLFLWNKFYNLDILSPFAWGALGGYLPDFLDNVPLWANIIRKFPGFKQFHRVHTAVHDVWRFKYPMPDYFWLGTFSQITVIIPCLWYILSS